MAITPHGDLHDTTSNAVSLDELLHRPIRYRMPDYQRRQAWSPELVQDWLNDTAALEAETINYLGQITTQPTEGDFSDGYTAVQDVVDGQQRLTVGTLTLAVGCHRLETAGEIDRAQTLRERYLKIEARDGSKPKIRLTELDDAAYQALMGNPMESVNHPDLEEVAQAINTWMDQALPDADAVNAFLQQFLRQQVLAHTQVGPEQSGYKLFDNHNARRSNPGPVDRIKTLVMATAANRSEIDKATVESAWYRARNSLDHDGVSETRFWRHWVMSNGLCPERQKVTKSTLFMIVSEIITGRLPEEGYSLKEFMSETADAAALYHDLATETVDQYDPATNELVNYHLRRIDTIGANPAQLLVLRVLREELDGDILVELLERLEKLTFPRRVTDKRVPNEVRAFIKLAHDAVPAPSTLFEKVADEFDPLQPSRVEFVQEFSQADWSAGKRTRYVVETLEFETFAPTDDRYGGTNPDTSVEHIAPRKAFSAKKYTPWRKLLDVNEDEFELVKQRIGNVTIFEQSLNQKAGSDPFEEKRVLYADSEFTMAREVAVFDNWSAARVEERSERLAETAADVWNVGT